MNVSIKNLMCCGNCKNRDITDSGVLQCLDKAHLSEYNYATAPLGVCPEWRFDGYNAKSRLDFVKQKK
jgi:hypothetical protein